LWAYRIFDLAHDNPRTLFIGTFVLAAGASCIALAPIMVKLSPLGPQASAFWRLAFALPLLGLWALIEAKKARGSDTRPSMPWGLLILAGVLFAGDLATWHASIVRTSAANATFLSNLTPIVVVAFTWLTTKALPSKAYWAAVTLALLGSLALSGGAPATNPDRLVGDGLAALTSIWYGLYLLAVARMRTDWGAGTIMFFTSLVAMVICLAVTLIAGEPILPPDTGQSFISQWWPLLVLGLLAQVGGQGLLAVGFGMVPTHIASVLILLQPVLVGFLGWFWLQESLTPIQVAGGALVLVGIWLAKRAG
jgi:drug/metabolite transporter (DMT)-like permease